MAEHSETILKACNNFRLDVNLVNSIIHIESGGNTFKCRFEPTWKYLTNVSAHAAKLSISQPTEQNQQSTSWGLMQVMGGVARELGFESDIPMLTMPDIGVFYGCKKLRQLFDRYGNEEDVIAAYNAGSAMKTSGGLYFNEKYVDAVSTILRVYRQPALQ